jgi:hypothetical protein
MEIAKIIIFHQLVIDRESWVMAISAIAELSFRIFHGLHREEDFEGMERKISKRAKSVYTYV